MISPEVDVRLLLRGFAGFSSSEVKLLGEAIAQFSFDEIVERVQDCRTTSFRRAIPVKDCGFGAIEPWLV